jgi:hypothetical protein
MKHEFGKDLKVGDGGLPCSKTNTPLHAWICSQTHEVLSRHLIYLSIQDFSGGKPNILCADSIVECQKTFYERSLFLNVHWHTGVSV